MEVRQERRLRVPAQLIMQVRKRRRDPAAEQQRHRERGNDRHERGRGKEPGTEAQTEPWLDRGRDGDGREDEDRRFFDEDGEAQDRGRGCQPGPGAFVLRPQECVQRAADGKGRRAIEQDEP